MLPADLMAYLADAANRKWTLHGGEIHRATLYAPDAIPLRKLPIHSTALWQSGLLRADPQERRTYEGYDLIQHCNDYDPNGILVWFPAWDVYGTWDADHHVVLAYPDVTWTQIAADPTWYVNGQWYPEKVPHHMVNPWE